MDYYTRLAVVLLEQKYIPIFTTVSPNGGLRGDDEEAQMQVQGRVSARAFRCGEDDRIYKTKYDPSQQRL